MSVAGARADARRRAGARAGQRCLERRCAPAERFAAESAGRRPLCRRSRSAATRSTLSRVTGFERIGGEEVWSGKIASVHVDRFRYDDGEEADREIVRHPGAVVIVAHDGEHVYLVKQPREAVGEQALLELPGRQARRGGGGAARHRQARARRGDRQGRERVAADHNLLHLAGFAGREDAPLPGDRPLRRARRGRRERADRDRAASRSPSSTARSSAATTRRASSGCSG